MGAEASWIILILNGLVDAFASFPFEGVYGVDYTRISDLRVHACWRHFGNVDTELEILVPVEPDVGYDLGYVRMTVRVNEQLMMLC